MRQIILFSFISLLTIHGQDVGQDKDQVRQLIVAINYGQLDTVKLLVKKGADVNGDWRGGKTPLISACYGYKANIEIVKFLVANGADIKKTGPLGVTSLMGAVSISNSEIVKFLIEKGADINAVDDGGKNALMYLRSIKISQASGPILMNKESNLAIVKLLVEKGINLYHKNNNGKTAFDIFDKIKDPAIKSLLLKSRTKSSSVLVSITFEHNKKVYENIKWRLIGSGPGFYRFITPKKKKVKLKINKIDIKHREILKEKMLELSKKIKRVEAEKKATEKAKKPNELSQAIMDCKIADVKSALEQDKSVNKNDVYFHGSPPLTVALEFAVKSKSDYIPIIKLLIEKGADLEAKDRLGKTALFYAHDTTTIKLLLEKGADLEAKDRSGKTALFYVFSAENIKAFIKNGVDLKAKDEFGQTVLFYVDSPDEIELLLENGLELEGKDLLGRTPLISTRSVKKSTFLLEKGADQEAKDRLGKTALIYAVKNAELDSLDIEGFISLTFKIVRSFKNSKRRVELLLESGANPNDALKIAKKPDLRALLIKYKDKK